jgi:arylsulfatase A-like enzyme/cytochrome c-type biogenesis protein CcmH/NrfG
VTGVRGTGGLDRSPRHAPPPPARLGVSRSALVLGLVLALASCGGPERGGGSARLPLLPPDTPLVLISIDTLRSDRLPAYGYRNVETPAIDRLRADGVLVERAYCHMSLTLPSHASLFTGLRPDQNGVRDNIGYRLRDDLPTLAELLRARGYATGAAVSSYVLRRATGVGRGFDFYEDAIVVERGVDLGGLQRPGGETLEHALRWLDDTAAQRPGAAPFLFFHIYEPHSPYTPSEPFASRYADPYDGEVAEADAIVGRLLDELEARDLYRRSVVVLLSDHGEGLMDHGEMEHEVLLYREMLQIPLLVKLPESERAGETVSAPVQVVDVLPTLLDLLGIERPAGLPGENLFALDLHPDAASQRQILAESVYPRLHFGWRDLASVIEGPHHLIEGASVELFDLVADPRQQQDLASRQPELTSRLRRALASWDREIAPPGAVDEETRRQLAALGYAAASPATALRPRSELPDPRTKIHLLEPLAEASRLYGAGRMDEAAAAYRRLVEDDPGMIFAWEQLGKTLRRLGDLDSALGAFLRAYELSDGAPQVALSLAEIELFRGRLDEAEAHAVRALPSHETAADLLAQIALRRGDFGGAEALVRQALESRGTRVEPLVTLTELRVRQERFADAIAASEQALSEFAERPDREVLRGLFYQRGLAFAGLGQSREAIQALEQEIELSPLELAPYPRLAFLYTIEGDGARAAQALRLMVERNPGPRAQAEAVRALRALGDQAAADRLLRSALQRWPGDRDLMSLRDARSTAG